MARIVSKCPREKCAACHTESLFCLSVKLRESQSLEKLSFPFLPTPQPLAIASLLEVLKGNALAEGTLLHFYFSQNQTFKFSSQWFSLCRRRIRGFIWSQYDAEALLRDVDGAEVRSWHKSTSLPLLILSRVFSFRTCSVPSCSVTENLCPPIPTWLIATGSQGSPQLRPTVQCCCSFLLVPMLLSSLAFFLPFLSHLLAASLILWHQSETLPRISFKISWLHSELMKFIISLSN